MDYRLEYVSMLFERTSKKRVETYVISRIWHLLSDLEVKFIPQQYVKRNNEKYALTDLYLPQIGLHLEINEPAHYISEERIEIDKKRKEEIEDKTNHFVIEVDCRESLEKIHERIDFIVKTIRKSVDDKRAENNFIPCENGSEFTPEYHKKKGLLRVQDEPRLRTIDDICELFKAKVPMRGYLRQGGVTHPTQKDILIWWPIESNRLWENIITENGELIYERHRDLDKRKTHVDSVVMDNNKRAVFFCNTDNLGFKFYRFKGIYKIDKDQTKPETGIVWRLSEKELKL